MRVARGYFVIAFVFIFNSCFILDFFDENQLEPIVSELLTNGNLEEIDTATNFPASWKPWIWDTRVSVTDQVFFSESDSGGGHSVRFFTDQLSSVGELSLIQEISVKDIVFDSEYLLSFYLKNGIMHEPQYGHLMIRPVGGGEAVYVMYLNGPIPETDWRLISTDFVFVKNVDVSKYEILISFQNDMTGYPDPILADDPLSVWVDDISIKLIE
jgi:hypothetical protein